MCAVSVSGMDRLPSPGERVEALEDRVDVARVVAEIEQGVERSGVEPTGELGIGAHELGEVELLLPGAHRVSLDEPVGLLSGEPGIDEREQQALAEEEPAARLEVLAHPLRLDNEPVDEPGEAVEHVVEREERVRGWTGPPRRRAKCAASA